MLNGTTSAPFSAEDFAAQMLASGESPAGESGSSGTASEAFTSYVPVSPFTETFGGEEAAAPGSTTSGATRPAGAVDSPFRSEYTEALAGRAEGPEREAYESLVADLYEREFSEALEELGSEAVAAQHEQIGEQASEADAARFLEQYMAPVATEAEALFERLAEQYERHDIAGSNETELDRLFEAMTPDLGHLSPATEDFLGAVWKKVRSVAKGAVDLARRGIAAVGKIIPLGPIFRTIGRLIRPLLRRVLQFAIGRLPAAMQPAARMLVTKLPWLRGESEDEATELEGPPVAEAGAASEADAVQREFDARASALLFVPEAERADLAEAEAGLEAHPGAAGTGGELAALDAARERFVAEIGRAESERDVTAAMENFLPVIMAALKIGVTIIGRDRVVGFLASLLAKLVGPLVGPGLAAPLSQAIVSTGLGLVGLELPADREALAHEAVTNAVEGTVRRLGELGESVLGNEALLEGAVTEAFAEAAAESFPPTMIRESLQEVASETARRGTWVLRPSRGPRRYKRYTQVLDVSVGPRVATTVRGFGGIGLDAFLLSRYGRRSPVRCRAHLFEVLPGTRLSTVARSVHDVPGLGPAARKGWRFFLPLTRANAAALFGEPGLGRDVSAPYLQTARRVAVGQRVVVLVPEDHRGGPPVRHVARASQANLTLDFPRSSVRLAVHLTEADAQSVAGSLRRGESVTPALVLLRNVYAAAVASMLSGNARRHVKIVHEVAAGEQFVGAALSAVAETVLKKVAEKLVDWAGRALSEFLTRRGREFVAAADDPAQGVTIVISVRHDPLMALLKGLLGASSAGGGVLAVARALLTPPEVSVATRPGFRT